MTEGNHRVLFVFPSSPSLLAETNWGISKAVPSNPRDGGLDQPSLRDWIIPRNETQDFVLGYFQSSLRDCIRYSLNGCIR